MSQPGSPSKIGNKGYVIIEDYFATRFGIYDENDSINFRERFSSVTSDNPMFRRVSHDVKSMGGITS